ncbi:hypothetical protein PR048_001695 [Dryococelus australis]|uniref:Uncharacterized protein n=1 Tax=Dryococelus australis TaxID=614101 RepID=A0ABQ9II84_9NEOP|nr:hypothetical protein PR048_001695 [Dryococelus australis]
MSGTYLAAGAQGKFLEQHNNEPVSFFMQEVSGSLQALCNVPLKGTNKMEHHIAYAQELYEQKRSVMLASAELNIPELSNYHDKPHQLGSCDCSTADSGSQGLKNDFYPSMKIRFKVYGNSDILTSATLLDLCFKEAPF